jgi:phenylacetic acid degradation operon negative regulatory protein
MIPARAALQPRALLLTLYGAYLRDLGGWAAVADLVTLMEDVEVGAHSTRSAISRMKQGGFLIAERRHGVAGYVLTEEATAMLQEGDERIYQVIEQADADGDWIMVVFSVPEEERAQRHRLRSRLAWLGFGQLSSGVWIAPSSTAPHARRMLERTGLDGYVTTWIGRPDDPASIEDWIGDAWDLSGLAAAYRDFAAAHEPVVAALESEAADDRAAFAAYLRLLSHWRRLPFMDPGLPRRFLPSPWPGDHAREVFARGRDALEEPGRRHVMATVGAAAEPV